MENQQAASGKIVKLPKRKTLTSQKQNGQLTKKQFPTVLEALETLRKDKFLNLSSMVKDQRYLIMKAERTETQYGLRILLSLKENKLFLPERYNNLSDELIEEMNDGNLEIINKGKVGNGFDLVFQKAEDVQNDGGYYNDDFSVNSQHKLSSFYNNFIP